MNLWELSVDAVTAIVHLIQIHHLETWWLNLCMYCWIRWCEQLIYCKIQLIVNRAPHHPRNANDPRNSWDRRAGWLSYSRNNAKKHEFHSRELCTEFVSYCRQCACKRNNLRVTLRDSWENMLETIASAVLFYFPQHAQCLSKSLKVHI